MPRIVPTHHLDALGVEFSPGPPYITFSEKTKLDICTYMYKHYNICMSQWINKWLGLPEVANTVADLIRSVRFHQYKG